MKFIWQTTGVLLVCGGIILTGSVLTGMGQNAESPTMDTTVESPSEAAEEPTSLTEAEILHMRDELFAARGFDEAELRSDIALQKTAVNNQEYIYDRMLNTPDYYTSLRGSYTRTGQDNYVVEYALLAGEQHLTSEKRISNGTVQIAYFDGTVSQRALSNSLTRSTEAVTPLSATYADIHTKELTDFVPMVASRSRIQTDADGVPTYYYREDLNLMYFCRESVFPQERAFGYLADFDRWEVAGQETVAGRDCFVLKGTLTGDYAVKQGAVAFTLWVDKESGVLLQFENYDREGQVTDRLVTTSFEINTDEATIAKTIAAVAADYFPADEFGS